MLKTLFLSLSRHICISHRPRSVRYVGVCSCGSAKQHVRKSFWILICPLSHQVLALCFFPPMFSHTILNVLPRTMAALKVRGGTSGLASLQCKVQVEKDVDAVGTHTPRHTHTLSLFLSLSLSLSLSLVHLRMDGYNYVCICKMMSVCLSIYFVFVYLFCVKAWHFADTSRLRQRRPFLSVATSLLLFRVP